MGRRTSRLPLGKRKEVTREAGQMTKTGRIHQNLVEKALELRKNTPVRVENLSTFEVKTSTVRVFF